MRQPFYIIWNPKGPTTPRFRHDTFGQAQAEAQRLALENPGHEFFVMQAHSRTAMKEPLDIEFFDTDGLPF